jgi:16S rRNA (guanine966-N2)-methyltransferase
MRIIAGRLKGRTLNGPAGPGLRPTSDSLRETLFNVIGPRVAGARVLDGFAGTGAIGLEAISRGAVKVTFVERDRRALAVLARNIERCGVGEQADVRPVDLTGLGGARELTGPFDIAILDPPYDEPDLDRVLATTAAWVAEGGMVVLEHSRRRNAPETAGGLRRYRVLTAGDSALSFYAGPAR